MSVYAVLVRNDEVLLCRLSEQLGSEAGRWTLPGGGIEFGEHILDALYREVEEETGLQIEMESWLTVSDNTFEKPDKSVQAIRLIARATVVSGSLRSESNGSTDLAMWHAIAKAESLPLVETARSALGLLKKQSPHRSEDSA